MDTRVIDKFWDGVEKTSSCWNWKGYLGKNGLPVIRMGTVKDGRKGLEEYSPRRLSLMLAGKELDPTARVQPWCRNKLCLNPSHLAHGDEARFWAKVQKMGDDDCWVWTASLDKDMYGKFRLSENGKKIDIRAHVYSWQLFSGRPVPKGVQVCHSCDHPYCVNPRHLFLGTTQDNTKDRNEKGRDAKGEKNGQSKLTVEKVKLIRELYATGNYTKQQLSDQFGVARSVIYNVVTRRRWKHVV